MKQLSITTRAEAMRMMTDSLFSPVNGHTLTPMRYCGGKYEWYGSASAYVGRVESVADHVHALWVERGADHDGPYAKVMCLISNTDNK